mmetsp:Transcript_45438/g.95223  ORF Transcript_45438/g.95223 Transcript_45438/m.95223 type:complete len:167 (-) Transcript_45438:143-643(-)
MKNVETEFNTSKIENQAMAKSLADTQSKLCLGACAWNGPFFHNLSSQILLFAANQQPRKDASDPHYFQNIFGRGWEARHPKYRELRNIYGARSDFDLALKLDGFLAKRNRTIYYSSVESLEEDISIAVKLLADFPVISDAHKEQVTTIKKYNVWKKTFPEGFRATV